MGYLLCIRYVLNDTDMRWISQDLGGFGGGVIWSSASGCYVAEENLCPRREEDRKSSRFFCTSRAAGFFIVGFQIEDPGAVVF